MTNLEQNHTFLAHVEHDQSGFTSNLTLNGLISNSEVRNHTQTEGSGLGQKSETDWLQRPRSEIIDRLRTQAEVRNHIQAEAEVRNHAQTEG